MTKRFASSIRHAVRLMSAPPQEHVHFHADTDGRPYVCDFHRCESPRLAL
jgi:hypothetical protein